MKIFYTVSKSGLGTMRDTFMAVLTQLRQQGVNVEATIDKSYWKGSRWAKTNEDLTVSEDTYRFIHDSAVRRAIIRADGVVIEASFPSFRLGFEAFFALSIQKPVLVLSRERNYGKLIDQPNFFGAKYTDFTLPDEIENFLRHVRRFKLRNRFNLFLSDTHRGHLAEAAKRYNISMSDYIRKLIEQDTGIQ